MDNLQHHHSTEHRSADAASIWSHTTSRRPWVWPVIIIASVISVSALTALSPDSPFRTALTLWFLFFCPGIAFIPLLQLNNDVAEITLAIAVSLAIDAIVSISMLYGNAWAPNVGLAMLMAISLVGAVAQIILLSGARIGIPSTTTHTFLWLPLVLFVVTLLLTIAVGLLVVRLTSPAL